VLLSRGCGGRFFTSLTFLDSNLLPGVESMRDDEAIRSPSARQLQQLPDNATRSGPLPLTCPGTEQRHSASSPGCWPRPPRQTVPRKKEKEKGLSSYLAGRGSAPPPDHKNTGTTRRMNGPLLWRSVRRLCARIRGGTPPRTAGAWRARFGTDSRQNAGLHAGGHAGGGTRSLQLTHAGGIYYIRDQPSALHRAALVD
jgi:hypothetical protein